MISQSHSSSTVLGNKPKKFNFVHQTISRQEARTGWAQDHSSHTLVAFGLKLVSIYLQSIDHQWLLVVDGTVEEE